ncbi:hypothetical protein A7E75_02380 [Syntrophotalea acetylenica]|uniref:Uncharacterized protein n=1 Tax=Syntrophotalea acetylenica TaxID=29542 RepID=A0A1L3GDU7_SYNAC|nr:hypothetical protein A7E75_02380 [Syntrophotalea acetylenica]APG44578.1 hypothetical protein A6070_11000 [Syntrophotalea acetylenica]
MRSCLCAALGALLLTGPSTSAASGNGAEAAAQMKRMFPQTGIDGFLPSPIPGLYEVTAGGQIFYFSPEGYLVLGEIWSKDGQSITAQRREQILAGKVKELPLDKAVTIGNGPHQVIEFTDPDCPYCRKLDDYLSAREDITRHIFFCPLETHPQARDKALYILCSTDRETAKHEVFTGMWDGTRPSLKNCSTTLLDEHLRLAGAVGVRGTPTLWVNGKRIGGANIEAIASILDNPNAKVQAKKRRATND